ncbi:MULTISPECIES: disulfide bond formation protein DsbB [Pseudoalteromonas]|uniref:Disulfide bond formation protein B n=1 Tax=Pseudoalteromonas obscura TaxID=3048491 RepID=A0ABT7EHJ2_9GAMM|nr:MULTISPECIES: disulfide bond formation protein DsbB [Pseudoalteromonas]MBQ4836152.1 disulfide bond formation protein DsbB [Pseudoalteromonas luteoviolacea]MDK2594501.1 disulfide bond formation protein DsbB [Pseudoalteromonas sp. P94(2023)]
MFDRLASFSRSTTAWALLFMSAFTLEVVALYFQYAMGLEPCVMCIYQRTAMLGVMIAALIGLCSKGNYIVRLVATAGWGVSSIWGWLLAREHISMQTTTDPFAFTCAFEPDFPVPLHEWIPSFFAVTGSCSSIDWSFAGLSMPGWMAVVFAVYAISFLIFAPLIIFKK